MPEADLLVIAGDLTKLGLKNEVVDFNDWLGLIKDKYRNIVLIAGNHDFSFQKNTKDNSRHLITNAIYLEDSSVDIDGYKIYGSPVTPYFGGWAFNVERGNDIKKYWDKIPKDTDILITHGPPYGVLDKVPTVWGQQHVGCEEMPSVISSLNNLKAHIFGHVHNEYGREDKDGIIYVNASSILHAKSAVHSPIVIEID
jgi:Icc-related predicted phosphoesterase